MSEVAIALIILHPHASLPCSTRDVCAADESTAALYFKIPLSEGNSIMCGPHQTRNGRGRHSRSGTFNPLCSASPNDRSPSLPLLLVELECFEFVNPLFLSIPHSFVEISSPGCSAGSALNQLVELWSGRRTMMFHPPRMQQ